jgi:putative phage-type endonuclease
MTEEITHILFQSFLDSNTCTEEDYEDIANLVEDNIRLLYDYRGIPERSLSTAPETSESVTNICLIEQIQALQSVKQPAQRTQEWYDDRHSIITASNIWKVFASDAQYNSFIYEKCQLTVAGSNTNGSVNTTSSLHWGVKYEPLTVMLYESRNQTRVGAFGCIKHPVHGFIGASPDGINVDETSALYGRMIEIKNIVNREITGIPAEAYWVQMQIQMEVCNLDGCDFVETRFKEYETEEAFFQDETNQRGVILHFVMNDGTATQPIYYYMPLTYNLEKEEIERWIMETRNQSRLKGEVLFQTIYWYLDEYSCVYVPRNRVWFESALPKLKEVWATIQTERETGFEHRAPKKRVIDETPAKSVCLIKLDSTEFDT